jgi:hypothetical protein
VILNYPAAERHTSQRRGSVREIRFSWLRLMVPVVLVAGVASCSLSLRGGSGPGVVVGTPTPIAAGGPPVVEIASPVDGTSAAVGQTVYVDARASDPWPLGIDRLELFANSDLVDRVVAAGGASRQSFGALLEWLPTAPGTFVLSVYAYRADGSVSAPASISMLVTGHALPTPTPPPSPTDSGLPFPTDSQVPTVTLSPSPPATPTPSPTPLIANVVVTIVPAELPDWTVGVTSQVTVHVLSFNAVPYIRVTASLAGSTDKGRTGALTPQQETTITLSLTPAKDGIQTLHIQGKLPAGYISQNPSLLVYDYDVVVAPAPATPTPTAGPTATPTASPG